MFKSMRFVLLASVFVATSAISIAYSGNDGKEGECDNVRASSSTGPCVLKNKCDSATTEAACVAGPFYKVMENFPLSCLANNGTNCSETLTNCWGEINCTWSSLGFCYDGILPPPVWTQANKRITVNCVN